MQKMKKVLEQAASVSRKRNLEGTTSSKNAFDVLSDKEIMLRASFMGVEIPDDNFEAVDAIRNLEVARNNLASKINETSVSNSSFVVDHDLGTKTPLQIDWHKNNDSDFESFTVVESRKSKRNRRKYVTVSRPITRSCAKASTPPKPPGRGTRRREKPAKYK